MEAESAHGSLKKVGRLRPPLGAVLSLCRQPAQSRLLTVCTAEPRPCHPRLSGTWRTEECRKGVNTKQVNIAVLIVKVIPGQEFTSNHLCSRRTQRGPGQDRCPGPPSSVRSLCHAPIWPREPRLHSAMKPKNQLTVVVSTAGTNGTPTAQNPSVFSTMHRPPTRSRAAPPPGRQRNRPRSHKATRTQWCFSLQGSTPLLSW